MCILKYLSDISKYYFVTLLIYFQTGLNNRDILCTSLYNTWFNLLCLMCFLLYLKHIIAFPQSQRGFYLHMVFNGEIKSAHFKLEVFYPEVIFFFTLEDFCCILLHLQGLQAVLLCLQHFQDCLFCQGGCSGEFQ